MTSADNVLLLLLAFAAIVAAGLGAVAVQYLAQEWAEKQPQPQQQPYEIRTKNPWGSIR